MASMKIAFRLVMFFCFIEIITAAMFDLLLSAELQNVRRIVVPEDHTFFLRLRCANCHEEPPRAVAVSREMTVDGVRGASVNVQASVLAES